MRLTEQIESQGNWLFRWRSYLPLVFLLPVVIALIGFHWPLGSYLFHEFLELVCLAVSLLGLVIRCATVGYVPSGTSGRNTRKQVASCLNTTGMYSVVRHPLYLGNYLIGLGATLVLFRWWLPVTYSLAFWLYYERIMAAEEKYLYEKFGESFQKWVANTPAFVPSWSHWQSAELTFSLRNVLRREYTAFFVVILLHSGIEGGEIWVMHSRILSHPVWLATLVFALGVYLLLRTLKRKTTWLTVAGR